MRFNQFKPRTLTEADLQKLDELRMNPTTLQQFGASDAAKGIMAGFEAELVFTGLGGDSDYDEYDMEPDMGADERCRSIQQVMDFFENDEWGYGTSGRDAERLQEKLNEKYYEWQDEQMYSAWSDDRDELIKEAWLREKPMEERIHAFLVDGMDFDDRQADAIQELANQRKAGKIKGSEMSEEQLDMISAYSEARSGAEEILEEDVEQTIEKQDGFYDEVLDEFRDSYYIDDDSGFFEDVGLRWMSDVAEEFSLNWPVMTGTGSSSEGGFSEENASQLAKTLSDELGVRTKVSSGYHSAKRDDVTWIFEPDSSLDADDSDNMPVEIVSPPMPLEECLAKMQQFFEWAEANGAYANSSTGFHMGVSLPHRGGDVDYVKLALFLGDEHVLEQFGRSSNHYAEAAIKKIRARVKGNKEAVGGAMDLMRNNLIELAQKALEINNHGFGKYTSINPQGGNDSTRPDKERGAKYIEFRSAGGQNYFEDIDKLKNTLLRYAQAMTIAANPAAERKEYYKKLYKLISPPEGDPAIDLFTRFATGAISSEELKKTWAEKQLDTEPKGDWKLWDFNGKAVAGEEFYGYTKSNAWEKAKKGISPGGSMEGFQRAYKLLPMKSQTGDWEVYNTETGETLETLHGFETKGAAADSVYDKYSGQGVAFNLRPADPESPEKPLTKRERLAKNIKAAPAEQPAVYQVINKKTGKVYDNGTRGTKSSLGKYLRNYEKEHNIPQGDLILKLVPDQDKPSDDPNDIPRTWQYINNTTGQVIASHPDLTLAQAEETKRRYSERYDVSMRTVPTDASQQRYNDRQEPNPVSEQPPEGMLMQRPATGDYYEVRGSNDRVYGYISSDAGRAPGGMGLAQTARQYVNNLTGTTGSYVQYRAGDPVQATAPNGVPMWEVYERDSGHVVHTFADHDQTSAWSTAQAWLRGVNAEDPSLFSCRPKMST
jgi:hypothetical protein